MLLQELMECQNAGILESVRENSIAVLEDMDDHTKEKLSKALDDHKSNISDEVYKKAKDNLNKGKISHKEELNFDDL